MRRHKNEESICMKLGNCDQSKEILTFHGHHREAKQQGVKIWHWGRPGSVPGPAINLNDYNYGSLACLLPVSAAGFVNEQHH